MGVDKNFYNSSWPQLFGTNENLIHQSESHSPSLTFVLFNQKYVAAELWATYFLWLLNWFR